MIEEILKDENIRHWIWWTVIPLSIIFGGTIASVANSKLNKCNICIKKEIN